MNPVDAMTEGTRGDQKRHGTFQTNFTLLAEEYERLIKAGGTTETMRDALIELLRAFEQERIDCEQRIHRSEREIDYCRAMQRACAQHSSLLVAVLHKRAGEWEKVEPKPQEAALADGSKRLSEEEAKQLCCATCGCSSDDLTCDCPCHEGKPCGNAECVPCKKFEKPKRGRPRKKMAKKK